MCFFYNSICELILFIILFDEKKKFIFYFFHFIEINFIDRNIHNYPVVITIMIIVVFYILNIVLIQLVVYQLSLSFTSALRIICKISVLFYNVKYTFGFRLFLSLY